MKHHFLCISFKSSRNSLFSLSGYRIRSPTLFTETRLIGSRSKEEKTRRRKKVGNVFSPMALSQLDIFLASDSPVIKGNHLLMETAHFRKR